MCCVFNGQLGSLAVRSTKIFKRYIFEMVHLLDIFVLCYFGKKFELHPPTCSWYMLPRMITI
jgi:hypothetical protein